MDIYAEITNRLVKEMEKGVCPWRKPWMAAGKAISHTTGKAYSLLNQMLLGKAGEYLTYNQVHPVEQKKLHFSHSTSTLNCGKKVKVKMKFTEDMMDLVIEKFGEDVSTEIIDDSHFRIEVEVAINPQFFGWVFGLGDKVMIENPLKVAKQMKDMLKERHKAYREEHSWNLYNARYDPPNHK